LAGGNKYEECPYCRSEVVDNAKKCKYCGEWVVKQYEDKDGVQLSIDEEIAHQLIQIKKIMKWVWIIIPIIALALFIINIIMIKNN